MKLSRIEPFAASQDFDSEATLAAQEISGASSKLRPISESDVDQHITDDESQKGVIRLQEFMSKLKKQKEKMATNAADPKRVIAIQAYIKCRDLLEKEESSNGSAYDFDV